MNNICIQNLEIRVTFILLTVPVIPIQCVILRNHTPITKAYIHHSFVRKIHSLDLVSDSQWAQSKERGCTMTSSEFHRRGCAKINLA